MSEDIQIDIKTTADTAGVNTARQALDAVAPAAQQAAGAVQSADAAIRAVGESAAGVNTARQSLAAVAPAAQQAAGAVQSADAAIRAVGGSAAGVNTARQALDAVAPAAQQAAGAVQSADAAIRAVGESAAGVNAARQSLAAVAPAAQQAEGAVKLLNNTAANLPPAAAAASTAVGKTSASLVNAQQAAQRTAGAIGQIGGAFHATGPAAQAFQGAMQVAAQGIQAFKAGIGGLVTILITLVAVLGQQIAAAFKAAREKVEAGKKANDAFGASVGKINEAKLTAIVAQYDAARNAADDACAASERLQASIRTLLSAQERVALAKIDSQEQAELAALDPATEAPEDRARIGAKYSRQRAATSADFAARIADSDQADAQKKVDTIQSADKSYKDQIAALKEQHVKVQLQRADAFLASLKEGGEGQATSSLKPLLIQQRKIEQQLKDTETARAKNLESQPIAQNELEAAKLARPTITATRAAAESSATVSDKASNASAAKRTADAAAAEAALRAKEKQLADLQTARDAEQKRLGDATQAASAARFTHATADTNLAGARTRASKLHQGKDAERKSLAPFEKADKEAEELQRGASQNLAMMQKDSNEKLKELANQIAAISREVAQQKKQKSTARMDSGVE
jgi:hypothetical protein